jgi:hypothetical protein
LVSFVPLPEVAGLQIRPSHRRGEQEAEHAKWLRKPWK